MSHSYYRYETEEEKLKRLMREKMQRIKNQLREARLYIENQSEGIPDIALHDMVKRERSYTISNHVVRSDEIRAGAVTDRILSESFVSDGMYKEKLDLSAYLELDRVFQDEEILRLQGVLSQIDGRIPDSDQARAEYDRLVKNINEIMGDPSLEVEDVIHMVEDRVAIYIENRNYDNSALDEDLLMDYKALCILLGEEEEVVPVAQLRKRVDKMMREYTERSCGEMVADMVNEAFEKLGMKVDGSCVLDGQLEGELYSSDRDKKCKVFISCNDSGILIEPVNTDKNADANVVADAQRQVCRAERELIEEVGRKGIVLHKVYSKEHAPEEVATERDLTFRESIAGKEEDKFEKMRNYNRMRKNRRRKQKSGVLTYE